MEQLDNGAGVGVIISPRDLAEELAVRYAPEYRSRGASVLIDQQFYIPDARLGRLSTYGIAEYRDAVSRLHRITDAELAGLRGELERQHRLLNAAGVIAPAVVYEAGRPDIVDLNQKLFCAAKDVGDAIGIPTYSTIVLGRSVTSSDDLTSDALSAATTLDSDGWYYAFEFDEGRVPFSESLVFRCCLAGLTLASTGKPVLHAFAGPMALLSFGFGATGAGIGHSQNLWQFTRSRWEAPEGQGGGGGDAPPRFFSASLWGTIIYPDETALVPNALLGEVLTHSPFSKPVSAAPPYLPWSRWDANKHLLHVVCTTAGERAAELDARRNAESAVAHLQRAVDLHTQIARTGIALRDTTASYQAPWRDAMLRLLGERGSDYDYLEMITP